MSQGKLLKNLNPRYARVFKSLPWLGIEFYASKILMSFYLFIAIVCVKITIKYKPYMNIFRMVREKRVSFYHIIYYHSIISRNHNLFFTLFSHLNFSQTFLRNFNTYLVLSLIFNARYQTWECLLWRHSKPL